MRPLYKIAKELKQTHAVRLRKSVRVHFGAGMSAQFYFFELDGRTASTPYVHQNDMVHADEEARIRRHLKLPVAD